MAKVSTLTRLLSSDYYSYVTMSTSIKKGLIADNHVIF